MTIPSITYQLGHMKISLAMPYFKNDLLLNHATMIVYCITMSSTKSIEDASTK